MKPSSFWSGISLSMAGLARMTAALGTEPGQLRKGRTGVAI